MAEETPVPVRRLKAAKALRAFQVYYLTFACFLVAYGELFPGQQFGMGRKIFNILIIPLVVGIVVLLLEKHWGPALRQLAVTSPSVSDRFESPRLTWREYLLGALLIMVSLGLLYSPYPRIVRKGLIQIVTAAILYFLILHSIRSKRDLKLYTGAFIAGGVLTAIIGVANYFSYGNTGTITWGNPNTFGDFLLMPISLSASIAVCHPRRWYVLAIFWFVSSVMILVLYLSYAQGAWLSCVVVIGLVSVFGGRRGAVLVSSTVALCLLFFILWSPQRFEKQGFSGLYDLQRRSIDQRSKNIWPFATRLIREHPLMGYGLNTYREAYEKAHSIERPRLSQVSSLDERREIQKSYLRKMRGNVHPHNELLQAWVSMGIPGIFFYGALFVVTLMTWLKIRRLKPDRFSSAIGLGVFTWYIGHTASGVFHCFFFSERTFCVAAVMYSLMFGILYLTTAEEGVKQATTKE